MGSPMLYLKGMKILMFQVSGSDCNPKPYTLKPACWVNAMLIGDDFPELGTDLVAALSYS